MATLLGSLLVSLGLESAKFKKGMTDAERQMVRSQKKFEQIGSNMASLGRKFSLGLTAPLVAFGGLSFKTASDAVELQSAFDQTFGDMASAMTEWATITGDAMGRSTQELQRAANTFGIFFNQAAPTRVEAAEMAKTFTVLSQDLASFYNVAESDALAKLRSGLAGESEPLRDFGVFLNEAAVNAKAMEMGLASAGGEIDEQAKIMARYQLILEATKNAQGDVARTSDGTANQMRAAQAAFEELQVTIGTKLLPVLTPLIEKLGAALNWFASLPDPVQDTVLVVAGLAAALGPVLYVIGNLTSAFGILLPVLKGVPAVLGAVRIAALALMANPVILAFAAVVAGIYLAWQNWDKIKPYIDAVGNAVSAFWNGKVKPAFDALVSAVSTVVSAWFNMKMRALSIFLDIGASIVSALGNVAGKMLSLGRDIIAGLVNGIKASASMVWEALKGVVASGIANVKAQLGIKSPSRVFMGIGTFIGQGLAMGIESTKDTVAKAMGSLADGVTGLQGRTEVATVQIAKSFGDMAKDTVSALDGMVSSIKGGGFLDILGSALDLFLQLGSTGLFGKELAANINKPSVPGFANGTRFAPGGLALVGERGPELVNLPRGSGVLNAQATRGMLGGGALQVEVVANNNGFGAVVRNHAGQVVAEAAPSIVAASGQATMRSAARRQSRRVA